jgi:hypothetical protein
MKKARVSRKSIMATFNPIETVFETTNYDLFKKMKKSNRDVLKGHVNKLVGKIDARDLTKYTPCVVYWENTNLMIADGQHRFEALKRLKKAIPFVIVAKKDVDGLVTELNSGVKNHSAVDKLKIANDDGNREVRKVYRMFNMPGHEMSVFTVANLLATFSGGARVSRQLDKGSYKVKYTSKLLELIKLISRLEIGNWKWSPSFVYVVAKLMSVGGTKARQKEAINIIKKHDWEYRSTVKMYEEQIRSRYGLKL